MPLLALVKGKGANGFGYGSSAEKVTEGLDLSGKVYLLTGCNSGIGYETLRILGKRGAHVIAAARTLEKAQDALDTSSSDGTPVACELSEPESVRACIQTVKELGKPLDGIICNAGIMALPKLQLQHGYELQFFTNHIGHFILVTGLTDQLAEEGRVVMVSSGAHFAAPEGGILFDNLKGERFYDPWKFYGQSKLANVLFAKQLAKRFEGTGRTAYALHPGVIKTNLTRHMNPVVGFLMVAFGFLFLKSIPQGAATQTYLATQPGIESLSGGYFKDSNPTHTSKYGRDEAMAERLWEVSEEIVSNL